jgi:hypothetical protein
MDLLGIPKEDQQYIIHSFNGKANHEPRGGDMLLYKMESVELENATKEYWGDKVGVITAYKIKDIFEEVSLSEVQAVWRAIDNAPPESRRSSKQAGSDWIGMLIKENLPERLEENQRQLFAEKAVKFWKDSGTLISEKWKDMDRIPRPILTYQAKE